MKPIIEVQNLSKLYQIGAKEAYGSLREEIMQAITVPFRHFKSKTSNLTPNTDSDIDSTLWALKDVSFEVQEGEVVGIIGRNGAGKSTLLKILSRITEPTSGKVTMRGRVASLLEVGTGFHPELTGRENIFLNGALLGMSNAEIRKKFDEIVAFAEIEKFLDTPVKRYSSGMYVRLAFAVAAHLEPEILIIDEVLAVGDAQFQKKCLGKMGEVGKEGKTVLFVSHNMAAVRQLCSRALVLESGEVAADNNSSKGVEYYLQSGNKIQNAESLEDIIRNLPPDPVFKLEGIALTQNGQRVEQHVENGSPLEIEIHYSVFQKTTGLRVYFDLCDDQDILLFRSFHDEDNEGIPTVVPGHYVSKAVIPADMLAPVKYELRIFATIFNVRTFFSDGIVIPLNVERTGKANKAYLIEPIRGKLAPILHWRTDKAGK
ncbi:MAG: polysaccharide ABC transporter ATP-binding protein [Deltaproteobacteria bacterium]|nr:polysaccharide ABC transporter ATP-binding protein [Deltaproteobacteria bacterium]